MLIMLPLFILSFLIYRQIKSEVGLDGRIKPNKKQKNIITELHKMYKKTHGDIPSGDIKCIASVYMSCYLAIHPMDVDELILIMRTSIGDINKFVAAEELRNTNISEEQKLEVLLLINDFLIDRI